MPVEPLAALFSVTELPLGLVVVLTVEPSLLVVVWILVPSGRVGVPVLAVGLCYEVESDVLRMLVYYILSLMSVNSPADSVLRAAFCHYPENYITLMEYYDPAEHGMAGYTRR